MDQHFLVSLPKLVLLMAAAAVSPSDTVVELGAGSGSVAAHVPPCRSLTLVELDAALAAHLRATQPRARVVQGDALALLRSVDARYDVVLSNLPHFLTAAVLDELSALAAETPPRFKRAVMAVRDGDDLGGARHAAALRFRDLAVLERDDFAPAQPFRSRLVLCTPRADHASAREFDI